MTKEMEMCTRFEEAIKEDKYHIAITVKDDKSDELVTYTYWQGIPENKFILRDDYNKIVMKVMKILGIIDVTLFEEKKPIVDKDIAMKIMETLGVIVRLT